MNEQSRSVIWTIQKSEVTAVNGAGLGSKLGPMDRCRAEYYGDSIWRDFENDS